MKFDEGLNTNHYKKFTILSSKGNELYTVILYDNHWKCNCKGFKFGKHCKHIKSIQTMLKEQYSSYLEHNNRCTIDEIVAKNDFEYIQQLLK